MTAHEDTDFGKWVKPGTFQHFFVICKNKKFWNKYLAFLDLMFIHNFNIQYLCTER